MAIVKHFVRCTVCVCVFLLECQCVCVCLSKCSHLPAYTAFYCRQKVKTKNFNNFVIFVWLFGKWSWREHNQTKLQRQQNNKSLTCMPRCACVLSSNYQSWEKVVLLCCAVVTSFSSYFSLFGLQLVGGQREREWEMEKEKETATLKLRRSTKAISCWSLHSVCKVPQPASCARQLPKAVRAVWSFHFKCTRTKCVGTVCVCRADNWKSLFNIKFQRPASRSRNHHYFWLKTHSNLLSKQL